VAELEPYFTKVTSVGAGSTCYNTADAWCSDSSTTVMTYAVAAVKTGGIESFFSNLVQNNDRDHDGLTDGEEQGCGTNPLVKDTDGDGFNDGVEVKWQSDPLDPSSVPVIAMPWLLLLLGN